MRRIVIAISIIILPAVSKIANSQFTTNNGVKSVSIPLGFTENLGQFDDQVLFTAKADGVAFYFSDNEISYVIIRNADELQEKSGSDLSQIQPSQSTKETMLIKAQFIGANANPEIAGVDRLLSRSNYFYGNDPLQWRPNVPEYSAIIYEDIYPGIDLKYYGDNRSMKYDFIIAPGADVYEIRIGYEGVDNMTISASGDLLISTSFGPIHENAPYAYQEIDGERREVTAKYKLPGDGQFGFDVAGYNPAYPLVIDPELIYSTYFGGSGTDRSYDIAVDMNGFIYVAGNTSSWDFPTANPYQTNLMGGGDIFISKFAPDGQSLIFSTFLGGNDADFATAIDYDIGGNIYVAGRTYSDDFPTMNPYQLDQPEVDVFAVMISVQGDSLIFSSYLGGNGDDEANDMAVDDEGAIFITGNTSSPDFPILNSFQLYQGGDDVFLTKFAPGGDSLLYSTFLGGTEDDHGWGIALDDSGSAYVSGFTYSSNFPTVNAFQSIYRDNGDIYISKLSPNGNSLYYSTYLGGSELDLGYDIAVDDSGNAYITGVSRSPDYPLANPYQSIYNHSDVVVTKLNSAGDSLIFSTYLGPGTFYWTFSRYCIDLDNDRNIYIGGYSRSSSFPAINAYQGRVSGSIYSYGYDDAFVVKLAYWGSSIAYSTFLGGGNYDYCYGLTVDDSGKVYITGEARSDDFPLMNQYQTDQYGRDGFISIFDSSPLPIEYCQNCVTGIVNNIEAAPLENVFVEALNTGVNDYTNSLGGYSLGNLVPGTYQISLSHGDYTDTIISDITVESGQLTNFDVKMLGNCAVRGVVVDTNSIPIESAYIIEPYFRFDDSTDTDGNFILSGFAPDSSYEFQISHFDYFYQTIFDISVGVNETLQLDTIYMVPRPIKMLVWFGNVDSTPVDVQLGDTFFVDVYLQNTTAEDSVGFIHIPLGSNDQYIVDRLGQAESQMYYPLTVWDDVSFLVPNPLDSGWTNQSFLGFSDLVGEPNPPFYSEIPAKVLSFAMVAANDSSLLGDTASCFIEGYHMANGPMIFGNIQGTESLRYNLFISPLTFIEPPFCQYITGDVNSDSLYNLVDISFGVSYFEGGLEPSYECECTVGNTWFVSGDVNGSCSFNGLDITYGVSYFKGGASPMPCADCPPAD